jgi:hypothetical protein
MHRALPHACLALLLSSGCESTASTGSSDNSARGNVLLLDEHNYGSTSSLSIPTIETAPEADLEICWPEALKDIRCHDVAPQGDIDTVALLRFLHLSEADVEVELTSGELKQSEVDGYLEYLTDHESTCARLSAMTFFGTPIEIEEEYTESDDHTYLLLFAAGTTPGVGAKTMVFVKPTADSTNTRVDAITGCGFLDFSAELTSVEKLQIPEDGPWVVDWREVTRDSLGNDIVFESIDSVVVGFFEGMTLAEIEAQILDLELIATSMWEVELEGGRTADLAEARGRSGEGSFPGFAQDEEGVWMLALMCSTCQNPSPIVLAVIEPTADGS